MNVVVATTALTAATSLPIRAAETRTTLDPIFAAIEHHKKANAEYVAAVSKLVEGTVSPDPDLEDHFGDREREACWDVSTTVPTTLPGLLDMLQYVEDVTEGKYSSSGRPDNAFGEDELRNVIVSALDCLRDHLGVSA